MLFLTGKNVEGKLCIKREGKSLELKIQLYLCNDEHKAPSSCNTTVYLSHHITWMGGHLFLVSSI